MCRCGGGISTVLLVDGMSTEDILEEIKNPRTNICPRHFVNEIGMRFLTGEEGAEEALREILSDNGDEAVIAYCYLRYCYSRNMEVSLEPETFDVLEAFEDDPANEKKMEKARVMMLAQYDDSALEHSVEVQMTSIH